MRGGVFISYRRNDSAHFAGRLVESIAATLPHARVFIDVDSITLGQDFVEVLNEQLNACKAMLVVIGPHWLESAGTDGQHRIDDPADFIRLEIETALARKIPIIPVLVDGAELPREQEIPESLRPMRRRQFIRIDHANYSSIVQRLLAEIGRLLGVKSETESPKPAPDEQQAAPPKSADKPPEPAPAIPTPTKAGGRSKFKVAWLFLSVPLAVIFSIAALTLPSGDAPVFATIAGILWVTAMMAWRRT